MLSTEKPRETVQQRRKGWTKIDCDRDGKLTICSLKGEFFFEFGTREGFQKEEQKVKDWHRISEHESLESAFAEIKGWREVYRQIWMQKDLEAQRLKREERRKKRAWYRTT